MREGGGPVEYKRDEPNPAAIERLERVSHGSRLLHLALDELWEELPAPLDKRMLVVRAFANIVKQHTTAQWVLIQHQLDVTATALVRPAYETMLRAIWAFRGADDAWIEEFLSPVPAALISDAETRMGSDVKTMLRVIAQHHPASIYEPLAALKDATWRGMHSYVHGGIRAVVQSSVPFPHHEAGSVLINANGMLILVTNVVRMAHGLWSPTLPLLQQQYADCLPNAPVAGV
jgi:hypothetical protein